MKRFAITIVAGLAVVWVSRGQTTYFMSGLLRQPSAPLARDYLGITNGGGGSGSLTNFSSGNLSPLFTSSVLNPTTSPSLSYSLISQSPNTVFAGPSSGSGFPTFRALVANDIPLLTLSKISDAGTVAGINLDGNASHYLNGIGGWTTPAGGGSGGGIDLPMTNLLAASNGTNFVLNFAWPAQKVLSTGDIAFVYSTNWGINQTSRVANLYIPPTNIFRHVVFINDTTNWHNQVRTISAVPTGFGATINFQLFGQGETNVAYTPTIDLVPNGTNWLIPTFNPTNSQGGCVFWIEATQGIFQDELGVTPPIDGLPIRSALDLSRTYGRATNASTIVFCLASSPNTTPGNLPALHFIQGGNAYLVTSNFSNLSQPNWCFMMFWGRGTSLAFLDGLSEGNRFACFPSESPLQSMNLYSGSSLTATAANGLAWRLFAFKQNSTTSVIRTNGVQVVSGNSGTQTPSRFTIASDYSLTAFTGNAYLAEMLIYHTNLSDIQVTNVENYFRTKYGAW